MGDKRTATLTPTAVKRVGRWVRSRSVREQVTMGVVAAIMLLVLLKVFVKRQNNLFVVTQIAHSAGLLVLIYKLSITKTCSGLSLKTQELTAIFLIMRIIAYFGFLRDFHVLLDSLTLGCTLWVIYMIRFKFKSTYLQQLDNMPLYYVLVPCAIVAIIGHPGWQVHIISRFMFVYLMTIEAVSVLPQLRLIQNAKMVEPFTAHYVFALGVARFLSCANWIFMLIDSKGEILTHIGDGHLYILVALLSEVVQTFILADFCYYYVKSVMEGQRMMRLPSLV
ncbi:putative ER lumen protein-retaining receptor C28H8.4 [Chenopodium quinoa]|uniref:putative ER lumen protein-retaining receptor C28H8.4 n=1 Tax=Chenopodium quinoa TaxID=63459 RepID=UPI000B782A62|nr:putative ER lumen protein-retaining receptor C28H8.4 [Chenopodium quinoa]